MRRTTAATLTLLALVDEQVAAMAALGCGYGQGHRYGRPAPFEAPPALAEAGAAVLAEIHGADPRDA
jgi:hypothetical protein